MIQRSCSVTGKTFAASVTENVQTYRAAINYETPSLCRRSSGSRFPKISREPSCTSSSASESSSRKAAALISISGAISVACDVPINQPSQPRTQNEQRYIDNSITRASVERSVRSWPRERDSRSAGKSDGTRAFLPPSTPSALHTPLSTVILPRACWSPLAAGS